MRNARAAASAAIAGVPRRTRPYNRFNVMLKNRGGDYQPGQWA
jgi:hypothetical protein